MPTTNNFVLSQSILLSRRTKSGIKATNMLNNKVNYGDAFICKICCDNRLSFVRWRRRRRRRWIHQLNHDDIHISNCLSTEAVEETTLKENMSLNTLAHSYRCWKRQLDMSWLVHNVSYYLNLQHAHLRTGGHIFKYVPLSISLLTYTSMY